MACRFPVGYFLVSFCVNRYVFPLLGLLQVLLVLLSYCLSIQPFRYVFWLPYFNPKSFGFFGIRLLVCFCVIPSQLLIKFSFFVLECSVLSLLFYPLSISLISLFSPVLSGLFPQVVVIFSRVAFSFLFLHIPASFFCFIILACFPRLFFICVSSRISYSGFDFSWVLRGSQ